MRLYFGIFALCILPIVSAGEPDADAAAEPPGAIISILPVDPPASTDPDPSEEPAVNWRGAMGQAALTMGFQHAFRVATQPKTRNEIGGSFWHGYWSSIKGIRGWRDGDSTFTNYVAHPLMGSAAGYIYVTNDRRGGVEFGVSREYWQSRLRATAFSAAYSTMFEIGPVSEATIGNVGLNPGTNGAVDFVMTPVGGLGWMVAEDALDKYVIRSVERGGSRWLTATLRCLLNPSRSVVELTRLRPPWRRAGRKLPQ